MKEFMKVLGLAIVGTALMFGIAALAAGVLRSYDREIIHCVLLSVVGLSLVIPLFLMDSEKDWVANVCMFCMGWIPMQGILIAAFL